MGTTFGAREVESHDLLPVDEFEMTGPLLVVGRETQLPSGAADLLAISRGGDVLIVEFKTGPQNADFRRVLAQLLDYGSDLWQLSYDEFQERVARRYFESPACEHPAVKGKRTLEEAGRALWGDFTEEDLALFQERIGEQLRTGAFHYLVVAQRFLPTMERTVAYLNAVMNGARFYAIELVRFEAGTVSAFEARTVLKPLPSVPGTTGTTIDEERFLSGLTDSSYRETLRELFEQCKGMGLRFEWGAKGTSIRLPTTLRTEPVSIGWLFPPNVVGWMGLTDLSLGYDPAVVEKLPALTSMLEQYTNEVTQVSGATSVRPNWLRAFRLPPDVLRNNHGRIAMILQHLVAHANAGL